MNRGPTKGFERDVGTKTTHHVMYPHSSTSLDNTTYLVLFPFKTYDLEWLIQSFAQRYVQCKVNTSVFLFGKKFVSMVFDKKSNKW